MKRLLLIISVIVFSAAGCGPPPTPTTAPYKHSLQATSRDDRLNAIKERQQKYGATKK